MWCGFLVIDLPCDGALELKPKAEEEDGDGEQEEEEEKEEEEEEEEGEAGRWGGGCWECHSNKSPGSPGNAWFSEGETGKHLREPAG